MRGIYSDHGHSRSIQNKGKFCRIGREAHSTRDVTDVFLKEVWKHQGLPTEIA